VGRSAPEFKSCCEVYLRGCINTHVPALLRPEGFVTPAALRGGLRVRMNGRCELRGFESIQP